MKNIDKENKMKILGIIMIVLPIISMFLWAGFNIQWWSAEIGAPQQLILMMFHLAGLLCGTIFTVNLNDY